MVLRWSSSCRHHTVSGSNTLAGDGPRSTGRSTCTGLNNEVHGAEVAVACYEGRPRNPVLIGRTHWAAAAAAAQGDAGARGFLRTHSELVIAVECGDIGRPDDLDTPDDLARIAGLFHGEAAGRD